MATESIRVSGVVPASPAAIFDAWLDGALHGAMTGGAATAEPRVGTRHTAWDGYIEGEQLLLEPARRIVQSWRSAEFPPGSAHSRLEVLLEPSGDDETEVIFIHTDIPDGQGVMYEQGWVDHYLKPMTKYFGAMANRGPSAPKASAKAAPKKAPAAKAKPAKAAPKKAAAAKAKPAKAKAAKAAKSAKGAAKKAKPAKTAKRRPANRTAKKPAKRASARKGASKRKR